VLHPPSVRVADESFSESEVTLPANPVRKPGKHKVLVMCWNIGEDQLIFDLTYLVEDAKLQPT